MMGRDTRGRIACFALLVGLMLVAFATPFSRLIRFALQQEQYSHIILVPLVSAALFFLERKRIFSHVETRWGLGLGLLFAGAVSHWLGLDTPPRGARMIDSPSRFFRCW